MVATMCAAASALPGKTVHCASEHNTPSEISASIAWVRCSTHHCHSRGRQCQHRQLVLQVSGTSWLSLYSACLKMALSHVTAQNCTSSGRQCSQRHSCRLNCKPTMLNVKDITHLVIGQLRHENVAHSINHQFRNSNNNAASRRVLLLLPYCSLKKVCELLTPKTWRIAAS